MVHILLPFMHVELKEDSIGEILAHISLTILHLLKLPDFSFSFSIPVLHMAYLSYNQNHLTCSTSIRRIAYGRYRALGQDPRSLDTGVGSQSCCMSYPVPEDC